MNFHLQSRASHKKRWGRRRVYKEPKKAKRGRFLQRTMCQATITANLGENPKLKLVWHRTKVGTGCLLNSKLLMRTLLRSLIGGVNTTNFVPEILLVLSLLMNSFLNLPFATTSISLFSLDLCICPTYW